MNLNVATWFGEILSLESSSIREVLFRVEYAQTWLLIRRHISYDTAPRMVHWLFTKFLLSMTGEHTRVQDIWSWKHSATATEWKHQLLGIDGYRATFIANISDNLSKLKFPIGCS